MSPQSSWAGAAEDVRRALSPHGRHRLGQFAVEGVRLVERSLRAGRAPKRALVAESASRNEHKVGNLLVLLEEAGCEIVRVPDGVLLELAEGRNGGIIFGLCDIPRDGSPIELAQRAMNGGPLLVLVNVEEPGNVGALVRTALASGASGVIAVGSSDPYHPKAVRTSMGSLFKLAITRSFEIEPVIEQLSTLRRLGAVASGGEPPWSANLEPQVALFVGQESEGLAEEVLEKLDGRISIPMPGGIDSFSVNAAAAILLYEIARRSVVH